MKELLLKNQAEGEVPSEDSSMSLSVPGDWCKIPAPVPQASKESQAVGDPSAHR